MRTDDLAVFRRHAADATLLSGGAAAILLQLADPRVASGVARHSDFRDRPLDRLWGTLDYVYAVGFGDEALVAEVVRRVEERHRPVHGRSDAPSGPYSAFDADAQRWVASTLLAVALELHERLSGPLDPSEADAIVRCYGALGGRLQAERAGWPETRHEFDAWWDERLRRLEVGDEARSVARALLLAPRLPFGLRLMMPPVRLLTAALLPAQIRDAFGLNWTPRISRTADAWLRVLAIARIVVPGWIRQLPMQAALGRVRRAHPVR